MKNTILEPSVPFEYKIKRIFGDGHRVRLEEDEYGYTEIGYLDGDIQYRNISINGDILEKKSISPEKAYIMKLLAENGDKYDRRPSEIKCKKCDKNILMDHRFFGKEHGFPGITLIEWHYECLNCGHCEVIWNGY